MEPPDTEGDVGPNYYIEWVNLHIEIFDKTGASVVGPVPGNLLFTALGGTCASSNDGDPIALYDSIAGRWLLSQFTGDNHQCIAVSTTGDPLGTFYLYDFNFSPAFPDYPKFGVWPDGYYYTARAFDPSFSGPIVGAFDREAMLNGDPASFQGVTLDYYDLDNWFYAYLPADLDGSMEPDAGAPGIFGEFIDDDFGVPAPYDVDGVQLLQMHTDWVTPANTTLSELAFIPVAPFDSNMCNYARNCIPQLNSPEGVDAISDRLMYRFKYRNFGDHQTLVGSHTVDATGTDVAGVRWYELRASSGGTDWDVFQQGTFAPDGNSRFMGDVGMDGSGNMMLAYTASSSAIYPSVFAAGRLAGDPLGTMAQGELHVVDGTGSKTSGYYRWGDYSSISVDPSDDCTFWLAQEYVQTTGYFEWNTRIAAIKFPTCGGPSGEVSGTVTNFLTSDPIAGATVEFVSGVVAADRTNVAGSYSTLTDGSGNYTIILPVDTYDATASKFGFGPETVNGIAVTDGGAVVQDFALTPVGNAEFDGYVTDAAHGWPLYSQIVISVGAAPVATLYTNPFNGYYDVELPQGMSYHFEVTPMYPGYDTYTEDVVLPAQGMAKNFVLDADATQCTAPGYMTTAAVGGLAEDFNAGIPGFWSVVNNGGDCVWRDDDPYPRGNLTGGSGDFVIADSDYCGIGSIMDTDLITPAIDFSSDASVTLQFAYDYHAFASDDSSLQMSTNNGQTWTTLDSWTSNDRGPLTWSDSVNVANSSAVRFKLPLPRRVGLLVGGR